MRKPLPVILGVILTGCASTPPPPLPIAPPKPLNVRITPDIVENDKGVKTSRYVIHSAVPAQQVRDVLSDEIDVNIPVLANMTVGDGMAFMLARTGIQLRQPQTYAESQLYKQTLPLVQTDMGYVAVRQGLQVMAGSAWQLEEDIVKREVGFSLKSGYVWNPPTTINNLGVTPRSKVTRTASLSDVKVTPKKIPTRVKTDLVSGSKEINPPSLLVKKAPASKTVKPAKSPMPTYVVTKGQLYMTALRQWVANDTLTRVAWALPSDTVTALETVSPNGQVFKGSLSQVVTSLGKQLKTPLHFTQNPMKKLAAIHTLDSNVELSWVHGDTLKEAVHHLTTNFSWSWEDRTAHASGSWRSPDNFQLAAPYPIVSPRGDFAFALNTVLEDYPVQAKLLYGTKTIFIMEKQ